MIEISGDLRVTEILGEIFKAEVELSPETWERLESAPVDLHTRSGIAQVGTHFSLVAPLSYDTKTGMIQLYCRAEELGRYLKGFDPKNPRSKVQWNGLRFEIGDRIANVYFMTGKPLSYAEIEAMLEEGKIALGHDFAIDEMGRVYLPIGQYMFGLNGGTPDCVQDIESRGQHLVAYEGQLFFQPRKATITRTSGVVRMGGDLGMLLDRAIVGSEHLRHLRSLYCGPATEHSIILEIENDSDLLLQLPGLSVTATVHRVRDHDVSEVVHSTRRNGDRYQLVKP